MDAAVAQPPRFGRELYLASKPFAVERRGRTWWEVISTLVPLAALLTAAALTDWPVRLWFSILGGLLMVRSFILFHDFLHGAILRDSRLGRILMYGIGTLLLTPPRSWRESHNHHHAHVGQVVAPNDATTPVVITDIGAFPMLSIASWRRTTRWQRLRYRLIRHPLTIFCAYFTVFMGNICLGSLFRDPRKHWPSGLVFLAHLALLAGLWWAGGWQMMLFAYLLPLWIAAAAGAYLFYIQHSVPGVRVFTPDEWDVFEAAMETASFLKTGRLVEWLTGNIGYHHVHHINSTIPFYRLRETMAAIPELQHPMTTRLRIADIFGCFRVNLWDPASRRMVSYREAAAA